MGQKTHPIGIRLGINRRSCSDWYAKGADYAFFVNEDQRLRSYVFSTYRHCIISAVEIDRRGITRVRIRIFSAQIVPMVGLDGKGIETLRRRLEQKCQRFRKEYFRRSSIMKPRSPVAEIQISVHQVMRPEAEARCLADFIVIELEKRTPFRRILRIAQERVKNLGQAQGFRFQISGRLNGVDIARTEWVRKGRVPLHTLSAHVDYAYTTAQTTYGLFGVQVWFFRPVEKKSLSGSVFRGNP